MKRTVYMVLVIVNIAICYSQSVETKKTTTMKKFDLEAFEKYKEGNDLSCRYTTTNSNGDSIEIYLENYEDSYLEYITYINTPTKKLYRFSKRTLNMISENQTFYDCAIGIRREYDEKGYLIKEIDNDEPYKFSWQDLVKKMKEEYDIDLMDKREQVKKNNNVSNVTRIPQTMLYYINLPREMTPFGARLERFEINATTGELVTHFGNPHRKHLDKKDDPVVEREWSPLID